MNKDKHILCPSLGKGAGLGVMLAFCLVLTGCFGGKLSQSQRGGEVTGISTGRGFQEPTPYGMTLVNRGFLHMGIQSKNDSLWGKMTPEKDVSVDGFWMDETEVRTQNTDSS